MALVSPEQLKGIFTQEKTSTTPAKARVKSWFGRGTPQPQDTLKESPPPTTEKFKKNYFVDRGNSTEAAVKGRRRETKEQSEWVQFSDKTRKEFTTFLDNYVTNLHDVVNSPGGMDILKAQPHGEQMYKLLSEGVSFDGTVADDTKLKANISKILEKPAGWVLTKELVEQETALGLMALGLVTSAEGEEKIDNQDPHDLVKRNFFDKHNKTTGTIGGGVIGGGLSHALARGGVDFWANVGDTFSNIPHGNIAMATYIGVGLGALTGYSIAEIREGKKIPGTRGEFVVDSTDLLADIQKDKKLSGYMRAMWGINVDDYSVKGGFSAVPNPRSAANVKDVLSSLAANLKTRESYFDDLGIPKDARDMMPEKRLRDGNGVRKSGERVNKKISAKYDELRSKRISPSSIPTPTENINYYRQAREDVLTEMTQQLIEGAETKPKDRPIASIEQKIKDRQEGGRVYEEKKNTAVDPGEIEQTRSNVGVLEEELGNFSALQAKTGELTQLQKSKNKIESELSPSDPTKALEVINDRLYGSDILNPDPGSIEFQLREFDAQYDKEYMDIHNLKLPKESDEAFWKRISPRIDSLNERYALIKKPLLDKQRELHAQKGELESLGLQKAQLEEQRDALQKNIDRMSDDFSAITKWGITNVDLESKPFDDLLQEINKLTPPNGWPEEENGNPENIARLWRAVIEAKADVAAKTAGRTIDSTFREQMVNVAIIDQRRKMNDLEKKATTVDLTNDISQLEVTQELIRPETQARIYGNSKNIIDNSDKYFNEILITDPNSGFMGTESEEAQNEVIGYYELLDYIFEYKNRPDREEYFQTINNAISKPILIDALRNMAIDCGLPVTGSHDTFTSIFTLLKANKNSLSARNIRNMFRSFSDDIEGNALAMS